MIRKLHSRQYGIGASVARATVWWNRLPAGERNKTFQAATLHRVTGVCPKHLMITFGLLGWRRERFWSRERGRRVLRVVYSPPGIRVERRPRGRPPQTLWDLFGGRAP